MALSKFAQKLKLFIDRYNTNRKGAAVTPASITAKWPAAKQKGEIYKASIIEAIDDALPQDLAAGVLTLGTIAQTSIILSWAAVTGADSYKLERARNAAFTTGKTTIYAGTLLTYTNTGLTASTQYYYRLTAISATKTDSQSAIVNATTTA